MRRTRASTATLSAAEKKALDDETKRLQEKVNLDGGKGYSAVYAESGRSKCRKCKQLIAQASTPVCSSALGADTFCFSGHAAVRHERRDEEDGLA